MADYDDFSEIDFNLIEDLERAYNRQRQNAITQELTEIVSGAQSMKEGG